MFYVEESVTYTHVPSGNFPSAWKAELKEIVPAPNDQYTPKSQMPDALIKTLNKHMLHVAHAWRPIEISCRYMPVN